MPIRVVLVDDHIMVRQLLRRLLDAEPDLTVVGSAGSAEEAIEAAERFAADVIVLDVDLPGLSSFTAARRIRASGPERRIVFLSAFASDAYIEEALAAGADGYVVKGEPIEVLLHTLRTVSAGERFFSPVVRARLVAGPNGTVAAAGEMTRAASLTRRERDVLACLARGMASKQVARSLHISVKTVDRHRANLMAKLDIHDRVSLARFAIREGLANV